MKIKNYLDKIVIGVLIIIFLIIGFLNRKKETNEELLNTIETNSKNTSVETNDEKINNKKENKTDTKISSKEDIYVHITGCILNPGVYKADKEDRINDIIKKAGGFCKNPDISNINLSKKITDEMKIHILRLGETISEDIENSSVEESVAKDNLQTKKVNINTANINELKTLPGIGDSKAKEIIAYRNNKKFENIEEIKNISGIGDKTFEKLKDLISIN